MNTKTYNFILGPVDTDSISFCKPDMSPFSEQEQSSLLTEINSMMPELVQYAHDGYYESVVCIKAKNYILYDGELHIKGSALRSPNKELALKEFTDKVIDCLVFDKQDQLPNHYYEYVREIHNVTDISRWTVKKTITESVLNPQRTNEQKVLDALKGKHVQMGDKIYCYFKTDESLGLQENWCGDHDTGKLLGKLYNTVSIFKNVINMELFPKFHLKSHAVKCQLADVLGIPHPEKVKRSRVKADIVNEVE